MNSNLNLKVLILVCVLIAVTFLFISHEYLDLTNLKASKSILNGLNVVLKTEYETDCNIINRNYSQYYHVFDGIQYPQHIQLYQNNSINFECLNRKSSTKTIFALNKFYGKDDFAYGLGKIKPFVKNHCPITNCELTNNLKKLNQSQFIVVSLTDKLDENIRIARSFRQRWVAVILESQINYPNLDQFNNAFSFTADFKAESKFGINYESQKGFRWGFNRTFNDSHDYSQGKSGFMGALISNCEGLYSKRPRYIEELRKYVNISIFGGCGHPCPEKEKEDCRAMIGRKFKFYFAAENSLCQDYITEKFFLLLKYDIVLVVYGFGNYSRFVNKDRIFIYLGISRLKKNNFFD